MTLELVLFLIPLCFGRIIDSSPSYQQIGNNKVLLHSKDASKRALQPALSIRNAPAEFFEIKGGENKFLECEAGGTPPPTIHWLKDGHKISQVWYDAQPAENDVMESSLGLGFTRSRLYLDCPNSSDAGKYTCVAENEYIRTFKTSQVLLDNMDSNNDPTCFAKKTFGTPARIHMWTHTRLEIMGTDVQLYCRTNGDPQSYVVWRGPNKALLNDPKKYEVLPNGDLIIHKILWSDMGGYTCQTKNSEGTDEVVVFLYPTMPESGDDM